ncbi:MAG: two-component system, sporulation sensor kinase D [Sphingobacteriales bacterium]|jgi:two-component system, sporulation sensor kinase D
MTVYEKKKWWKLALLIGALAIGISSLLYTSDLVKKLSQEERKKVTLWANATKKLISSTDENEDLTFLLDIINNNETVPVILTDVDGKIDSYRNLNPPDPRKEDEFLLKQIEIMREQNEPISFEFAQGQTNVIYFKNSILLTRLRFYPWVQLGLISIFLGVSYLAFSNSRRAEQNQVWVGMSKETAHQLGTPISSLLAWMEHLKLKVGAENKDLLDQMEADVNRLELITDRFSKIGSVPKLEHISVRETLENSLKYLQPRTPGKIGFTLVCEPILKAMISPPLFEWVIENLVKNAANAIAQNEGSISLVAHKIKNNKVAIDVQDNGAGIPKSRFNTVFEPGFTTRKRGWGLGLSLARRIIENYHNGQIFVKSSEVGKGTVFRIVLEG